MPLIPNPKMKHKPQTDSQMLECKTDICEAYDLYDCTKCVVFQHNTTIDIHWKSSKDHKK